jgi:xylulokinase
VALDENGQPVRKSIIWCDSRAVPYGDEAFEAIGAEACLENLLNSPGNFTAAKLAWVKANEPKNFQRIKKIMLPGDYLAYRFTGDITTTASALSEAFTINLSCSGISLSETK